MSVDAAAGDVRSLLEEVRATFPARFAATARLLGEAGMDAAAIAELATEVVGEPEPFDRGIPTLREGVHRPVTPMLAARFAYAGTWTQSLQTWLGIADMERAHVDSVVGEHIASHREHWEGSAPARFPSERLSLFGLVDEQPEDQTYLVWPPGDGPEPELWTYAGHHEQRFPDLRHYLRWVLTT